jgi:4-hydroxybenzoate polyprenyltransferase
LLIAQFDALNPRTANRHLPAGKISLAKRVGVVGLERGGLGRRELFSELALLLSLASRLVVVCFYSLTKRFTDYTHVFLGVALALAHDWRGGLP